MTEEQIFDGCKRGDRAAQRELYVRYAGKLLAIGMRYLPDRDAAEDVLQDVYVKVLCSFSKFDFRGEGSLQAWLSRVMVNSSLEYLRKDKMLATVPVDSVADDIADEEIEVSKVPQSELLRMIGELPVGYRTVFNLFVFEGKSHKEIAGMLGINEKSSSSQFFRAKTLLGKKIKDYIESRG